MRRHVSRGNRLLATLVAVALTQCLGVAGAAPAEAPSIHTTPSFDVAPSADAHAAAAGHAGATLHQAAEVIYTNPLPHVLILTAIVVGVATTAVGLALAVRIREAYGTIEEDELEAADDISEFGHALNGETRA